MEPSWIRNAPNQITATEETFRTSITVGKASAMSRPARRAVSVTSALACPNRAVSTSSRTKARTTRMPVSCSRRTRLTVSIRVCMSRNSGTIRVMMSPTDTSSTGTLTAISQDSCTSCRMAMITPPMLSMGAATIRVAAISTSCWTCWTSFVERVISDGAPNRVTSCSENAPTRVKIAARRSRPTPMAAFAPKYTAVTAQAIWTRVMTSIRVPTRRMYPVSPFATPSSMMSAFRVGRYRDAMDCASWKTTTASSSPRCGRRYSTSSFQSIRPPASGPIPYAVVRVPVYDRLLWAIVSRASA